VGKQRCPPGHLGEELQHLFSNQASHPFPFHNKKEKNVKKIYTNMKIKGVGDREASSGTNINRDPEVTPKKEGVGYI
jgi:hypothetical protein